jgi:hypothetical protein
MLGAYLPARALIETMALLLDFEHELNRHVATKDKVAIDKLLTNHTFATKDKDWVAAYPDTEAVNILKFIDRVDKRLMPGIRTHYNMMSERCHPNWLGHHAMFAKLETTTGMTTFSETKDAAGHYATIFAAMTFSLLGERSFARLEEQIGSVVDLQLSDSHT